MKKGVLVNSVEISIISIKNSDYISLADMLRAKDGDFFISDWLKKTGAIGLLGRLRKS